MTRKDFEARRDQFTVKGPDETLYTISPESTLTDGELWWAVRDSGTQLIAIGTPTEKGLVLWRYCLGTKIKGFVRWKDIELV